MRKLVLAALAAVTFASTASAGGYSRACTYSQFYGSRCTWQTVKDPAPPTEAEIEAKRVENAKWEAFCKPVRTPDSLGMIRLTYAHPGCEFGRSE